VRFFFIGKMATFYVPENLSGQTLRSLSQKYGFRGDVLGNFAGVGEDTPLKEGQAFNLPSNYGANSSEGGFAYNYLTPQSKYLTDQAQKAIQPAVQTLQSGIDPLKQKYTELIASIRGKQDVAVEQAGIASAQEFGKRGIPLSSGAYDQFLQKQVNPVNVQYEGLAAETGLGAQNAEQSILNAIASLQGQAGFTGLEQALAYAQLNQQNDQFNTSEQRLRDTANQGSTERYTTLGEGSTLYDLLQGKALFTAPKSYKETQGQFDPLGLFG
jgi:hypothetical protein